MKRSWFDHSNLTTQEAEDLILLYQSRNIQTKKQLSLDRLSWCVSAYLEESNQAPTPSSRWQSALGRRI